MPRAFSRSGILLLVCVILGGSLSGCTPAPAEVLSLGDWVALISDKAGIQTYDQQEPYFVNVGPASPYFEPVQAAVEWKVLDTGTAFDPDSPLTREWAAFTLMNLSGREIETASGQTIRDLSSSVFPDHVNTAVSCGLMSLDSHQRFRPKKEVSKEEAYGYLSAILDSINHRIIDEPFTEIEWDGDLSFAEEEPEFIDPEEGKAVFPEGSSVKEGQYFTVGPKENPTEIFQVKETTETEDHVEAVIEPAKPEEVIAEAETAQSFTIDFTTATIIDDIDGMQIQASRDLSYTEPMNVMIMSADLSGGYDYTKSHTINGYTVSYSVTATGIKAEVTKETDSGLSVFGNLRISAVRPTFQWKLKNGSIEDGYFTVEFETSENLGARIGSYKNLYGDFSRVDPKDFVGTVKNFFQKKQDAAEISLPLATITVPVPSSPVLSVEMQLQLRIYSSGRAELSLTQDQLAGMEIRDGKMREIHDFKSTAEAGIRASTSLMGAVKLGMNLAGMTLADIVAEAGAKALVSSKVHLYDSEGNHTVVDASELPADLVDDLSDGNGGVLACADIKAYKVADIQLNTSDSLAGRMGLSKTITLWNETNGKLIPGMKTHMENGHFVDHCTRGDRLKAKNTDIVESDQIRIASYSMILDPGESKEIRIKELPSGYGLSDLVFSSERPEFVHVNGTTVTGISPGSSIVHICTSDGKFDVSISVLVREET